MNITMDDLRRGIFMWCFFSLWQIMFVDGVSVGLMGTMITPSLLVHCRGKVHCRSHHYMFRMVYRNHRYVLRMVYRNHRHVFRMVYRNHSHVLRMVHCRSHRYVFRMVVFVMIEIQEVSDWVLGGVLCGILKRIHVVFLMLNDGGRC